jgi:hypothetical protein
MVGAAVVGGDTPAFGAGPVPPLRLADTHCHDGSDNVLLRYQANRQFARGLCHHHAVAVR